MPSSSATSYERRQVSEVSSRWIEEAKAKKHHQHETNGHDAVALATWHIYGHPLTFIDRSFSIPYVKGFMHICSFDLNDSSSPSIRSAQDELDRLNWYDYAQLIAAVFFMSL